MTEIDLEKTRREKIFEVIIFFDLFNFPLSILELKKFSSLNLDLRSLALILEEEIRTKHLEMKNGFYFLSGREELINIRRERYNYSLRKIKIARFFSKIFFLMPSVSSVCLVNSIGSNNLRDGSDIDFLIITKSKRIWLARLFCTGIAKVLNKRPTKKNKRDKICLSFYLSEERLCLEDLKIEGGDPYFYFWERSLVLLQDRRNVFSKLVKLNNLESFYFIKKPEIADDNYCKNKELKRKNFFYFFEAFDYLEKLSKIVQVRIMPKELLMANSLKAESQGVVIANNIIKLYLSDKRLEIKEKYERKISEFF